MADGTNADAGCEPIASVRRRQRSAPLAAVCAWLLLMVAAHAAPAVERCCGDCDGDGAVEINELVRAVDSAGGACPVAPKLRLQLPGAVPRGLQITFDRPAVEGRVAFTVNDPNLEGQTLFLIGVGSSYPTVVVTLVNQTLRFFTNTYSGGQNPVLDIDVSNWSPGGAHRIEASWGRGQMLLVVDGTESWATAPNEVVVSTGTRARFGMPGDPETAQISDISFATD